VGSSGGDPHHVLGVPRGASEADIKRAYRALAKRHHPDAGPGPVARFLEIQAAYEALTGGDRPGAPSRPGAQEWARRPRPGPSRPPEPGPATSGSAPGGTRSSAERGPGRRRRPDDGGGQPAAGDPARSRRSHGRRRATLGSTSYDEAEGAFEPDWGGASWYGPSSGTYWTLNPREYADPRKHGPEYQARARRRSAAPQPDATGDPAPGDPGPGARGAPRSAPRPDRASPAATSSAFDGPTARPGPAGAADPAAAGAAGSTAPAVPARVALAVLAWLAPGLALAAAAGLPGGLIATLPLQAAGVALLALAPRAAWAALGGAVVLVFAALPIVAVVAALGGSFVPGGPAPAAAVVLAAAAWLGGLGAVAAGRVAPYPWRPGAQPHDAPVRTARRRGTIRR